MQVVSQQKQMLQPAWFLYLLIALLALSLSACLPVNQATASSSLTLLISTYDAGSVVTEGFRLSESGQLGGATWTNANQLMGATELIDIGKNSYLAAVSELSKLRVEVKEQDPQNMVLGPPSTTTVELILPKGVDERFKTFDYMPESVMALVSKWRAATTIKPLPGGYYVWAVPAHPESSPIHFTVSDTPHDSSILKALGETLFVVPASDDLDEFIRVETPFRTRYLAGLSDGAAYFGLLKSK